jgi:hypothetical protein
MSRFLFWSTIEIFERAWVHPISDNFLFRIRPLA